MTSTAGFSSATDMWTPYAHPRARRLWVAAAVVVAVYGIFLVITALQQPSGVELTGQFALQPAVKAATAVVLVAYIALLAWFWPRVIAEGMAVPVTLYIPVLGAMVCAALLALLPTPWTVLGAVCFAVSDAMIGIGKFVLAPTNTEALAVPIWWAYATSLLLIAAGFFFARSSVPSATPSA